MKKAIDHLPSDIRTSVNAIVKLEVVGKVHLHDDYGWITGWITGWILTWHTLENPTVINPWKR